MNDAYRKRPVRITAKQWDGGEESAADIIEWIRKANGDAWYDTEQDSLVINTLEGEHLCPPDWWIIQGVEGEFYGCKDSVFDKTYEPAAPEPALHGITAFHVDEAAIELMSDSELLEYELNAERAYLIARQNRMVRQFCAKAGMPWADPTPSSEEYPVQADATGPMGPEEDPDAES